MKYNNNTMNQIYIPISLYTVNFLLKNIEFNQHIPMQAPNHQQYIVEMGMFFWIVTILKDKLTFYNTIMSQRLCILHNSTKT